MQKSALKAVRIIIYNSSSRYFGVRVLLTVFDWLSVHQSDGLWEKTVLLSGCFSIQSSLAPPRGEKLEQVVSRVWRICSDASCPFPDSGGVEVLDGVHQWLSLQSWLSVVVCSCPVWWLIQTTLPPGGIWPAGPLASWSTSGLYADSSPSHIPSPYNIYIYIYIYIHRSAIKLTTLWPLTGEVNNIDYLVTTASGSGLSSKWTFCPCSWCVGSRKNGQA